MSRSVESTYCYHENCMLAWEYMIVRFIEYDSNAVKQDFERIGSAAMRQKAADLAKSITLMESDLQEFSAAYDGEWVDAWDCVIFELIMSAVYEGYPVNTASQEYARELAAIIDSTPEIARQIEVIEDVGTSEGANLSLDT